MLGREIEALKDIKSKETKLGMQYPYDYVPVILSKGMFILEKPSNNPETNNTDFDEDSELQMSEDKKFLSFYVMPKYGLNLEQLFTRYNNKFSSKTILQIGIKLVDIIEKIHLAGYTYNDLKLDNILVGDHTLNEKFMHEVRLIDFGFSARFQSKSGTHIEETEVDVFRSNMIFATINQFEFRMTSRRDDL